MCVIGNGGLTCASLVDLSRLASWRWMGREEFETQRRRFNAIEEIEVFRRCIFVMKERIRRWW